MRISVAANHKYIDEIQTIAQVFFPHARFVVEDCVKLPLLTKSSKAGFIPKSDLISKSDLTPKLSFTSKSDTVSKPSVNIIYRIVSIIANGKVYAEVYMHEGAPQDSDSLLNNAQHKLIGQHRFNASGHPAYLSEKRLAMLAMYHAMQQAVGAYTPWGALTGVRPTKMVREWMAAGQTDDEISHTLEDTFCVQKDRAQLAVDVAHAENRLAHQINTSANHMHVDKYMHHNQSSQSRGAIYQHEQAHEPASGITASNTAPTPIGLYLSIPFCPSRCIYCSFNTAHKPWSKEMQTAYTQAVVRESTTLPRKLQELGGHVSSIYIGGGTPTAMANECLEQLLDAMQGFITSPIEFTVEAGRPDTITRSNLRIMQNYGVNRISINPQTLNNRTLKTIGRNHTAQDFLQAFESAREEGFTCINTDIIAGLPGEAPNDMHHTMETLAKLAPENITVHTLAIKRASKLNEQRVEQSLSGCAPSGSTLSGNALPNPTVIETQLKIAHESCINQGLSPYYLYRQKNMAALFENTGFARPGYECLYNVGMMSEVQTVLGIGAGAVSKYIQGSLITRDFNPKDPDIYIKRQ